MNLKNALHERKMSPPLDFDHSKTIGSLQKIIVNRLEAGITELQEQKKLDHPSSSTIFQEEDDLEREELLIPEDSSTKNDNGHKNNFSEQSKSLSAINTTQTLESTVFDEKYT